MEKGEARQRKEKRDGTKTTSPSDGGRHSGKGEGGGRASSEPSLEGHADMQGESRRPEGRDRSIRQRKLVEGIAHRADTSTTGEAPDI